MSYEVVNVRLNDTYFKLGCGHIVHRAKGGKKKGDLLFCSRHGERFPIVGPASRYL